MSLGLRLTSWASSFKGIEWSYNMGDGNILGSLNKFWYTNSVCFPLPYHIGDEPQPGDDLFEDVLHSTIHMWISDTNQPNPDTWVLSR